MGLCGSVQCGCAIQGGDGIDISGSGSAGDPLVVASTGSRLVAQVQSSTVETFTTTADIPGMAVTFDADPTHIYRFSYSLWPTSSVAGDSARVTLTNEDGSTTYAYLQENNLTSASSNGSPTMTGFRLIFGLSGVVTLKLRGERRTGTGSVSFANVNTLMVEDLGVTPS